MMSFTDQLHACHERLVSVCAALPAPYPAFTLFFSVSDGSQRAHVVHARAADFETAWREGAGHMESWVRERGIVSPWLRIDWVEGASPMDWAQFKTQLTAVKRNYFRLGLAFDKDFSMAFTEQELNANAMLCGDSTIPHSVVNARNFEVYSQARFERSPPLDMSADQPVYLLATVGVFCQPDGVVHKLVGTGLDAGRRQLPALNPQSVLDLVRSGSSYLARQVQGDGLFVYGYFPCFDRRIPTYDAMRHASAVYAMLESWELTRDETLRAAIDRALDHLTGSLIRDYTLLDGRAVAFLVDTGGEIKLGGNAACVLALVKYCELMETRRWLPLLERLALGIVSLQDPATGRFNHVLHAADLTVKQASRIIYYDGEAAYGLMRLYSLTREPQWLAVVEKAFDHFIASQHWQAHDHWLSCCVHELTHWSPQEKYFRFGLQNVAGYLDFVLDRKTTFPTLLELMLAAQQMLQRLEGMPAMRHLLDELDTEKFYRALDYRAHYLLNGFFWPEMAMYFRRPSTVVGSFFIRHHSFRVRIDDVEQYLSGFAAYHRYLVERRASPGAAGTGSGGGRDDGAVWTASEMARVTGGEWVVKPEDGWRAAGVAQRSFMRKGRVVFDHQTRPSKTPLAAVTLKGVLQPAAAVLCSDPKPHLDKRVPVLKVSNVLQAVLELGDHARAEFAGRVCGVLGSGAGSGTVAAMLAGALTVWGEVGQPEGNISLPSGIAWNMTCMPRHAAYWVLEMGTSHMPASAQLVRPSLMVVTGLSTASQKHRGPSEAAARLDSRIFQAMVPGDSVVLNRDMAEFATFAEAAMAQQLQIVTCGEHRDADVRLLGFDHGEVQALVAGEPFQLRLNAPGRHMGASAIAALAALQAMRLPLAAAVEPFAHFEPPGGRGALHTIHIGGGSFKLIDETYDANPSSMRAALELLSQAPCEPARRVAILGDMQELGPTAQRHHLDLEAELLASQPDRVLLCGPLMRALHARIRTKVRSHWFVDVSDLSTALGGLLQPGDWVLAKSSAGIGLSRLARVLKALP
ncbi:Mur ligase family protein [Variovorax sp. NFACC27]|uniref:glutamate ligase domain-containing protein n=1 Tax=unclassified Variovorax TaxID=663243 RepID=UPI00089C657F|nr:UDP-N-acetylmuramyl pentapeptide synthase [Variovorax sp. NFACC28]SEG92818.1 UDP-N-acetylmuramyl pentapeptide synthase [Variovorax sp. NFACC29]SFD67094.1 UDP-N-acetylmuramyl pentapeptide synthase [Variovorax sp. NFACC26]SFG97192.1 UDP-N-acetylmuramyl pentapeptide synthase [Variovorax sp. NFACC27]